MTDEFACLEFCQSEAECDWFTFYPQTNYCELFLNCTYLDSDICPECLSGSQNCTVGKNIILLLIPRNGINLTQKILLVYYKLFMPRGLNKKGTKITTVVFFTFNASQYSI